MTTFADLSGRLSGLSCGSTYWCETMKRSSYDIAGLNDGAAKEVEVIATNSAGEKKFRVKVLLLTPKEVEYYRHGGILPYVLRQLAGSAKAA